MPAWSALSFSARAGTRMSWQPPSSRRLPCAVESRSCRPVRLMRKSNIKCAYEIDVDSFFATDGARLKHVLHPREERGWRWPERVRVINYLVGEQGRRTHAQSISDGLCAAFGARFLSLIHRIIPTMRRQFPGTWVRLNRYVGARTVRYFPCSIPES